MRANGSVFAASIELDFHVVRYLQRARVCCWSEKKNKNLYTNKTKQRSINGRTYYYFDLRAHAVSRDVDTFRCGRAVIYDLRLSPIRSQSVLAVVSGSPAVGTYAPAKRGLGINRRHARAYRARYNGKHRAFSARAWAVQMRGGALNVSTVRTILLLCAPDVFIVHIVYYICVYIFIYK